MKSFSLFNSLLNPITLRRLTLVPVATDMIASQAWVGAFLRRKPLRISKLDTSAQLGFAGLVLATQAFGLSLESWLDFGVAAVTTLTLASTAVYLAQWLRHMSG